MKKQNPEVINQKSAVGKKNPNTLCDSREPAQSCRRSLFLAIALVAVILSGSVSSQPQARQAGRVSAQTATQAAPETTAVESLQSVVAKQAALVTEFDVNGLKVLMKRREGSPTVSAGLFLRGGTRNITADNAGIEALMLASATEATTSFPRERMRSELSRMGTIVSDGVNSDYSVLTLATTRLNFDRSWEIFTDVALHPSFAKEDVALVQSRLVASLRDDTDDPDTYLQRLQERVAYTGHPYANRAEGTAESVGRLTPGDLQQYHQKMLETSRLLLVIVGDLDPAQLRSRITASFGKLPRGNYKPEPVPQLSFDKSTVAVTARGLPTNYVQGLFTAPQLTSPDIYPMRVASSILRDRVFEEVRVKRNLSYAPDAFLRSQAANIGGIYVSAVDANQAVRVMLDEIARLQRESIDNDDIKSIVAQFLTSYYMGQETNAAQAGDLAQYELIGGGWRNSLELIDRLRAVTPADVQRVARKYMRNIRFVVLGDPKAVDTSVFTNQVAGQ
jgi:zinc protease